MTDSRTSKTRFRVVRDKFLGLAIEDTAGEFSKMTAVADSLAKLQRICDMLNRPTDEPTEVLHAPKSWADVASNNAKRATPPPSAVIPKFATGQAVKIGEHGAELEVLHVQLFYTLGVAGRAVAHGVSERELCPAETKEGHPDDCDCYACANSFLKQTGHYPTCGVYEGTQRGPCNCKAHETTAAPWRCTICNLQNPDDATHCRQCEYSRFVTRNGQKVPREGR